MFKRQPQQPETQSETSTSDYVQIKKPTAAPSVSESLLRGRRLTSLLKVKLCDSSSSSSTSVTDRESQVATTWLEDLGSLEVAVEELDGILRFLQGRTVVVSESMNELVRAQVSTEIDGLLGKISDMSHRPGNMPKTVSQLVESWFATSGGLKKQLEEQVVKNLGDGSEENVVERIREEVKIAVLANLEKKSKEDLESFADRI